MIALRIFEFLLFYAVLVLVLFQVVIPYFNGVKIFPFFRRKLSDAEKELKSQIDEVKQAAEEADLRSELKSRQNSLKDKE